MADSDLSSDLEQAYSPSKAHSHVQKGTKGTKRHSKHTSEVSCPSSSQASKKLPATNKDAQRKHRALERQKAQSSAPQRMDPSVSMAPVSTPGPQTLPEESWSRDSAAGFPQQAEVACSNMVQVSLVSPPHPTICTTICTRGHIYAHRCWALCRGRATAVPPLRYPDRETISRIIAAGASQGVPLPGSQAVAHWHAPV